MINVTYSLTQIVNGKPTNTTTFSHKDVKLIIGGLIYAKEKDYQQERKSNYKLVVNKINDVMNGKNN